MNVAASRDSISDRIAVDSHVRRMRSQRHVAVAGVTFVTGATIGSTVHNVFGFFLVAFSVSVVLGSLGRATDARLGHWWGWLYGEPEHATWLDISIDRTLRHLVSAQNRHSSAARAAPDPEDQESRIRILPLGNE